MDGILPIWSNGNRIADYIIYTSRSRLTIDTHKVNQFRIHQMNQYADKACSCFFILHYTCVCVCFFCSFQLQKVVNDHIFLFNTFFIYILYQLYLRVHTPSHLCTSKMCVCQVARRHCVYNHLSKKNPAAPPQSSAGTMNRQWRRIPRIKKKSGINFLNLMHQMEQYNRYGAVTRVSFHIRVWSGLLCMKPIQFRFMLNLSYIWPGIPTIFHVNAMNLAFQNDRPNCVHFSAATCACN